MLIETPEIQNTYSVLRMKITVERAGLLSDGEVVANDCHFFLQLPEPGWATVLRGEPPNEQRSKRRKPHESRFQPHPLKKVAEGHWLGRYVARKKGR
jgi:hypothetical protein